MFLFEMFAIFRISVRGTTHQSAEYISIGSPLQLKICYMVCLIIKMIDLSSIVLVFLIASMLSCIKLLCISVMLIRLRFDY